MGWQEYAAVLEDSNRRSTQPAASRSLPGTPIEKGLHRESRRAEKPARDRRTLGGRSSSTQWLSNRTPMLAGGSDWYESCDTAHVAGFVAGLRFGHSPCLTPLRDILNVLLR